MNKINNRRKIVSILLIVLILVVIKGLKIQKESNINIEFRNKYREVINNISNDDFDNINNFEKELENIKKYSEATTLRGIKEYKNENIETAKKTLNLALKNRNNKTDYLAVFYTHKYLFEINAQEGNYQKAKTNLLDAIQSIPKKYYNESSYDIGELIKVTYKEEQFRQLAVDMFNEIMSQKKYVKDETELYLRQRISTIYILSNRYAEATNNLIDSIHIAEHIGDNYNLLNSMISLALICSELGGEQSALDLMEKALTKDIYNVYQDADIKLFGYLNLAYLQLYTYKDCDKVTDTLSKIEQYRDFFTEEDFRDAEIYKLIYETDVYVIKGKLDLAKENINKIEELFKLENSSKFTNKELEYQLAYARYFYALGNYNEALRFYQLAIKECELREDKNMLRSILKEVVDFTDNIGDEYYYHEYTQELIDLSQEIESLRYYDYTVYISKTMEEEKKVENNYNRYISSIKILFTSAILILVFYAYTRNRIKTLKYSSEYDGLTSVYNRKKFDIDYKNLLRKSDYFACIIIDIDNFKKINDTYGHGFGDIVIRNSSKKIKNLLPKNYNLYRYGGEEFVILAKYKTKDDVINLSEQARQAVEQMIWKENITVTISIGVAFSDIEKDNVLQASDVNLYKAKNNGRNNVVY